MNEELIEALKKKAREKCWSDSRDFNAFDFAGGNFDDAYEGGTRDGEIWSARWLLKQLDIEY